jgi:hypothetical protein
MSVSTKPKSKTPTAAKNLVEMNWDPITRIVGSLGVFTKIDFENKQVAECYSTSSIFRGYSIFMKGKDPRDAHICTWVMSRCWRSAIRRCSAWSGNERQEKMSDVRCQMLVAAP